MNRHLFVIVLFSLCACTPQPAPYKAPSRLSFDQAKKMADDAMRKRAATQGKVNRNMPEKTCFDLRGAAKQDAVITWDYDPMVSETPQESWCHSKYDHSRYAPDSFPGVLPDGATSHAIGNGGWVINY